jgi:predicted Zn-dependent protease
MLVKISIILVVVALIIIATIILKKFPALAILDVENIPGQKEAKFKEEIIKKRIERNFSKWGGFFIKVWHFFNSITSKPLHQAYEKLKEVKDFYRRNKKLTLAERREHVRNLFLIAEESLKNDDLEKAENSLIEIISLEQKNLTAFVDLADVYAAGKKWPEARQTLGYALKLAKSSKDNYFFGDITVQKIYFSLALVNKSIDDNKEALDNISEALEIEPNNPKYLDLAIELAISESKKNFAMEMFNRLEDANPENAKLAEIKEEITQMKEENTATIE